MVVGRDDELAEILAFIDGGAPAVLLLEGEAGIGKTTLWRTGVDEARGRGQIVLSCNPGGGETHLSLAGLRDLLDEAFDDVAEELPEPQRRVLGVALLRFEPAEAAPQASPIAASFLSAVRALAARGPVLLAVDDVQWLDAPSAGALEYAARRLRGDPVRLLLAARTEGDSPVPLGLDRAFATGGLDRIAIGPLSLGALGRVIRMELGTEFPRQGLRRLHEASGGNPMFALELVRALQRSGRALDPGQPFPVPGNLHDLVRGRITELPDDTRAALVAVASLSHPTIELLERVFEADGAARLLRPALDGQVIRLAGDRVEFTHPLLASAVYADAGRASRKAAHRRLARVIPDREERALHLALGAEGPSEDIAAELDLGVRSAARRGAHDVAVELAELAVRLTPEAETGARQRRTIDLAEHSFVSGRFPEAEDLVSRLLHELPPGRERARALVLSVRAREENLETCVDTYAQALEDADGDLALQAEIHRHLVDAWIVRGDLGQAAQHARSALAVTERTADQAGVAMALADVAHIESLTARVTPGLLERALELEERVEGLAVWYRPSVVLGLRRMFEDRLDEARALLERAYRDAADQADEYARAVMQMHLVQLEVRAGELLRAERYAEDSVAVFGESGSSNESTAAYTRALVAAHQGRVDEARDWAARSLAASEAAGEATFRLHVEGLLGFLELSLGNPDGAVRWLRPLPGIYAARGYGQPNVNPVLPDLIEALIMRGELDEAEDLARQLEERGMALASSWALTAAARCRGLLTAARGNVAAALAELEQAVKRGERLPLPLERGRTLLALGQAQRRARKRAAARRSLERALSTFEGIGSALWTERAAGEIARLGGRAPARDALTATEQHVADLVAQGKANKEVASALFVSVKTVEFHLGNVYRKLGVRSRTELAHCLRVAGQRLGISLLPVGATAATLAGWLAVFPDSC
jgi:ATP/maltotriose-dependent transcriptional regulator MalT